MGRGSHWGNASYGPAAAAGSSVLPADTSRRASSCGRSALVRGTSTARTLGGQPQLRPGGGSPGTIPTTFDGGTVVVVVDAGAVVVVAPVLVVVVTDVTAPP